MAKHFCFKQWVNGYELSVSVDDNLCDKFRAEVVLFKEELSLGTVGMWHCTSPIGMAEIIEAAYKTAKSLPKGNFSEFESYIKE